MDRDEIREVGQRIKFIRLFDLGLSQQDFAEELATSQKSLSSWETGKVLPPTDVLVLINKLSGRSVDWILGLVKDNILSSKS